jgi:hypothetical protein
MSKQHRSVRHGAFKLKLSWKMDGYIKKDCLQVVYILTLLCPWCAHGFFGIQGARAAVWISSGIKLLARAFRVSLGID